MATVVAGAANMQMKMTMLCSTVVAVLMGVQFQPERRADCKGTHYQQSHTYQKFRPRRHGLHMGQVFQTNGDQRQNHNSGGVTSTPSQGVTKSGQWLVQGEGRHRHQVVSTTHHMNSAGGNTGQKAYEQVAIPRCLNSAGQAEVMD